MNSTTASTEGSVHFVIEGAVARVVFDRPRARNAMTWSMYEKLGAICESIRANPEIRVVAFAGAGGEAFVAGTDIAQFTSFETADAGIAYERRLDGFLHAIDTLPVPTVAAVEGWCVGGGLAIAAVCDVRIATPTSRFGVPIARTLGNCLSTVIYSRLLAEFGLARTKRMLLCAEFLSAEEAREAGFVSAVVEPSDLKAHLDHLLDRIAHQAPITMRVSKEAIHRLLNATSVDDEDLLRQAYGSEDFREGVRAFIAKRKPQWRGH